MRLIRAFVKSNPSAEYIGRVSAVFAGTPNNARGNLQAVVRAILTDAEARDDVPVANSGRLENPIYNIVAFVRALGGSISPTNQQAWPLSRMSQTPFRAPSSVFGFYSPLFRMPRSSLIRARVSNTDPIGAARKYVLAELSPSRLGFSGEHRAVCECGRQRRRAHRRG